MRRTLRLAAILALGAAAAVMAASAASAGQVFRETIHEDTLVLRRGACVRCHGPPAEGRTRRPAVRAASLCPTPPPLELKVLTRYGRAPDGADRCRWMRDVRSAPSAGILALHEAAGRHAGLPW
jgi:hypothetical protein